MDKYYTPKIEEFHVGFEYEQHTMTTGGLMVADFSTSPPKTKVLHEPDYKVWAKSVVKSDIFSLTSVQRMKDLIKEGRIRVKRLDGEDVKGLGFVQIADDAFTLGIGTYRGRENQELRVIIRATTMIYLAQSLFEKKTPVLFTGYIKNKSEFKRILNQLNIEVNAEIN